MQHHGGAASYDEQIQSVQRAQSLQHVRICLCFLYYSDCCILAATVGLFLSAEVHRRRNKLINQINLQYM